MMKTIIKHAIMDASIGAMFDAVISNFKKFDANSLIIGKKYTLIRIVRSMEDVSDAWKYCIHDYEHVVIDAYDGMDYLATCVGHFYIYTDDITPPVLGGICSWSVSPELHVKIVPSQIFTIK